MGDAITPTSPAVNYMLANYRTLTMSRSSRVCVPSGVFRSWEEERVGGVAMTSKVNASSHEANKTSVCLWRRGGPANSSAAAGWNALRRRIRNGPRSDIGDTSTLGLPNLSTPHNVPEVRRCQPASKPRAELPDEFRDEGVDGLWGDVLGQSYGRIPLQ